MFFWTSSEYLLCSTRESASCSFGTAWGNTFWLNCYLWVSCSFKIVASWWVAFIKNPCLLTFGTWQVLNLHPCCIICALGPEVVSVSVSVLRVGNMRLCCKTESHYSWDLLWPDIPQLSAACPVYTPVFCKCHAVSTVGQASLHTSREEHGLPTSQSHHVNLPLLLFFILDDFDSLKIMEQSELPPFPFHLVLGCLLWGKEMHHCNVKRVHVYSLLKRLAHYKRLKTAAALYIYHFCFFINNLIHIFS